MVDKLNDEMLSQPPSDKPALEKDLIFARLKSMPASNSIQKLAWCEDDTGHLVVVGHTQTVDIW